MHARSTSLHADLQAIDDGIAHIRDAVLPALRELDGFVGMSFMVNRDSGHCVATAAYRSEEAMRASSDQVQQLRQRAVELMQADHPDITEWEIAVLHRDHRAPDGACVRALWMELPVENIDHALDVYRMAVLPQIEQTPGFCSASLMIDRQNGRAVSSVSLDSREAMEGSRERAQQLRERSTAEIGARILHIGEFELAVAHLDVPEMA